MGIMRVDFAEDKVKQESSVMAGSYPKKSPQRILRSCGSMKKAALPRGLRDLSSSRSVLLEECPLAVQEPLDTPVP